MINLDYIYYIRILLILLYEKRVLSRKEITDYLKINNDQYKNMIDTLKKINKPKLIHLATYKHVQYLLFGDLNFDLGIIFGNRLASDYQKYDFKIETL